MLHPTSLLADALADRLTVGYGRMFGSREPEWAELVAVATRLTLELIGDSDALYHDAHHTALVTLVGQDVLRGRLLACAIGPADWAHVTLALLLHDIGFVRGVCPGDGRGRCVVGAGGDRVLVPRGASDAFLAPYHVERGKLAVRARFASHGTVDAERIVRAIERTRFPVPEGRDHAATDDEAGLVRAADLIGQLADPFYHRKLTALFAEFSETGMAEKLGCKTAADLGAIFSDFFTLQVEPYIGDAIRYLELTTEGKQWIANLHSNLFQSGHRPARIGPFPGGAQPTSASLSVVT